MPNWSLGALNFIVYYGPGLARTVQEIQAVKQNVTSDTRTEYTNLARLLVAPFVYRSAANSGARKAGKTIGQNVITLSKADIA